MSKNLTQSALELLVITGLFASACVGDPLPLAPRARGLVEPNLEAVTAAETFLNLHPGVRVLFSQDSGEILWVDGQGQALQTGVCATKDGALTTAKAFLEANPGLFRFNVVKANLVVAEPFLGRDVVFTRDAKTGVTALRFEQTVGGINDATHYGIAYFRPDCALTSLVATFVPDAPADGTQGLSGQGLAEDLLTTLPPVKEGWARRWHRVGERKRIVDIRIVRDQYKVTREIRDARTGALIETVDETREAVGTAPGNWLANGEQVETTAPDTLGVESPILSTRLVPERAGQSGLVMGFTLPGILQPDQVVSIGDAAYTAQIPLGAMATDQDSWGSDPAYTTEKIPVFPGTRKDATRLIQHLLTAVRWFSRNLAWNSWDGQGTSFHAAIRGNRDASGLPGVRAFGGNGFLLIEGGHSPLGLPISEAIDIVGHEFAHSVIDATAGLSGGDEAGALNEGLADFFGKAVEGYSADATVIGAAAGHPLRDVRTPSAFGYPETYGDMVMTSEDRGGTHSNSGIITRALSRVVFGDGGFEPAGVVPVASLVLGSLRHSGHSPWTLMETFAVSLAAQCAFEKRPFCASLEAALDETELLDLGTALR